MTPDYRLAIEWDVDTWSRALSFWEKTIERQNISLGHGLEIGARHGGLSWYFAKQYGSQMCCTDHVLPSEKARLLHDAAGLSKLISYQVADATRLPFPENHFDFVVFKSVLGAVGRDNQPEKQLQALHEIHRVLRPGGHLFFAENLRGSTLHQIARRSLVPWGKTWRYLTISELCTLLTDFEAKEIHATGFFAAFVPRPAWLKNIVAQIDSWCFFIPKTARYVGFGYARK